MAQAEAEYKDFILFYPTMEEAAESQKRICEIHIEQMEKAGSRSQQRPARRARMRQLITQFPNSKFVPETEQKLRNIQEVLAEAEMCVGDFYHHKGSNAAAANRFGGLVDQYPLFSRADVALWEEADSYRKMGNRAARKGRRCAGENRARLSAERLRGTGQEDAEGTGDGGPRGRSEGRGAHEVGGGESQPSWV